MRKTIISCVVGRIGGVNQLKDLEKVNHVGEKMGYGIVGVNITVIMLTPHKIEHTSS